MSSFSSLRVGKCNNVSQNCAQQNSANQIPVGKFCFPFIGLSLVMGFLLLAGAGAQAQTFNITPLNGQPPASSSQAKGNANTKTFQFRVTITGGAAATNYSVNYRTSDVTAVGNNGRVALDTGFDYVRTTGTLTFAGGSGPQLFPSR